MKIKWFSCVLLGGVALWAHAGPSLADPAYRTALEARLQALEEKKSQLEEVPGPASLNEQRQCQSRIDGLQAKLGTHPSDIKTLAESTEKLPVSTDQPASPASSMPVKTASEEVDYFHDRSQVMAVDEAIKARGAIRPAHSSLLAELPRTRRRAVSEAPKRGVVIDGDGDGSRAVSVQANPVAEGGVTLPEKYVAPPLGPPLAQNINASNLTPGWGSGSLMTPPPLDAAKAQGIAPDGALKDKSLAPQPGLFLPLPPAGTSVWGSAVSTQDYRNKAGWSMPAPEPTEPLFAMPSFNPGMLPEPPVSEHDPRLSFSPKKLMQSWPRG